MATQKNIFILMLILSLLNIPEGYSEQKTQSVQDSPAEVPFIQAPPTLTLEDCLAIALRENRILNQSRFSVSVAQAKKSQLVAS